MEPKIPKFEKRHFEYIALIFLCLDQVGSQLIKAEFGDKKELQDNWQTVQKIFIQIFADQLEPTNPNFNKEMFMEACKYAERT